MAPSQNRWFLTPGVLALGPAVVETIVQMLRDFSDFNKGNDPHGERDFGCIESDETRVFWKIDYYDRTLTEGSSDPADEEVTCRVLTLMLATEY